MMYTRYSNSHIVKLYDKLTIVTDTEHPAFQPFKRSCLDTYLRAAFKSTVGIGKEFGMKATSFKHSLEAL